MLDCLSQSNREKMHCAEGLLIAQLIPMNLKYIYNSQHDSAQLIYAIKRKKTQIVIIQDKRGLVYKLLIVHCTTIYSSFILYY